MKHRFAQAFLSSSIVVVALSAFSVTARAQFTPYCFGTVSACPCGNGGGPGEGCRNSFGTGAELDGAGNAHVGNDTVVLHVQGLPTAALVVFFQGTTQNNNGFGDIFGDGLRCADGNVTRLAPRTASAGQVSYGFGIPGDPSISVKGMLPASGGTFQYQAWYRNTAAFCTPEGLNLSNGLTISWLP